jgi:catechol 2,3-dioxygenase-like lactoylglutathione lyase family enzyme
MPHRVGGRDDAAGAFYRDVLGMPFVAQQGNPWPLRCDGVAGMRTALEAKGVQFFGATIDTGVCLIRGPER